jgi:hypothetical protein
MRCRPFLHRHLRRAAGLLLVVCAIATAGAQVPGRPTAVQVYAASESQLDVSWQPFGVRGDDYEIFRDGVSIGTTTATQWSDAGLQTGTAYGYSIVARNSAGTSAPTVPHVATTRTPDGSFVMDGWPDFDRHRIEVGGSCGCGDRADLGIWAAVRGQTLYVAMRTIPPGGAYDYFLLVSASSPAPQPAPWGKAGTVVTGANQPFIGAESTNSYVGWFNAPASAQVVRSANPAGVIEGTLDLVETFGYVPSHIRLVALAYETHDGGNLMAQSPRANYDDNYVSQLEMRWPLLDTLRDEDQDGFWDRIDPKHGWSASIRMEADGTTTISAPAVSKRRFSLLISDNGPAGPYYYSMNSDDGADSKSVISITDRTPPAAGRFYRIRVEP